MLRKSQLLALLVALWAVSSFPSLAQQAQVPGVQLPGANGNSAVFVPTGAFKFLNITTDTTTTVKSGAGVLHTITVNTANASSVITVYDSTAASGTKIATITLPASGGVPVTLQYDAIFQNGLTVVTTVLASDFTVSYD